MQAMLAGRSFPASQKTRYDIIVASHNLAWYKEDSGVPENVLARA